MPLDCEQIRNEFSALLDDELNSEDRELVEEHLSDCSECLRELHGYQQVSDAYRYHHPVKAPADFEDRLRERMAPATGRGSLPVRTWVSLAAAACATLVAGIILWQKPLPDATFQLSKNEAESMESAPMMEERASARRDLDATAPAADAAYPEEAAEEPQMSAFYATEPSAESDDDGIAADAQDAIPAPAEPQMRQFIPEGEPPATAPPANESTLAMKSTPLATEAEVPPVALGRSRAMGQRSESEENMAAAEAIVPAPETPPADATPEAREGMSRLSGFDGAATADSDTATQPPARKDDNSTLEWRERTFTLRDGKWRQESYAGERTTRVVVPSGAWNKLLDEYQDLNKLVTREEPVVVKLGETWYDIRRAEPAPETAAPQGR